MDSLSRTEMVDTSHLDCTKMRRLFLQDAQRRGLIAHFVVVWRYNHRVVNRVDKIVRPSSETRLTTQNKMIMR
jgi:hypothetical protein